EWADVRHAGLAADPDGLLGCGDRLFPPPDPAVQFGLARERFRFEAPRAELPRERKSSLGVLPRRIEVHEAMPAMPGDSVPYHLCPLMPYPSSDSDRLRRPPALRVCRLQTSG